MLFSKIFHVNIQNAYGQLHLTKLNLEKQLLNIDNNFLKSINDSKSQLCPKCMYNPYVQDDDEKMTRVFKPNAKPGSKDGSWGFSKWQYSIG